MSSEEISPVEFGKLIRSVDHLTGAVTTLAEKMEDMEARLNTGKGLAIGLIIISGGMGAFAHKLLDFIK